MSTLSTEPHWTAEEERRLVRKLDWRLLPFLSFLQLLSFLDRVNIGIQLPQFYEIPLTFLGNAKIANKESGASMEEELGLSPNQYSFSLSIFFVGYVLCEVPSNIMMKKARPSRWISRIMVTWGLISTCMAAVHDFRGLAICRALLGAAEAGFFPGVVYYFSFW
jgi:MFS family permease